MKKFKVLLIALIMVLLSTSIFSTAIYAADNKNLSYQLERPYSDDNSDGTDGNDVYKYKDNLDYAVVKIFNAGETEKFKQIFYCLRRGKGFGNVQDTLNPTGSTVYNLYEDMKANATTIIAAYNALYSLDVDASKEIEFNGKTYTDVNLYNAILWIADNAYLPVDSENYDASEYKEELLSKIGILPKEQSKVTDDDIEVIQQLAFWFFTNNEEVNKNITNPSQFLSINDNNDELTTRRAKYLDLVYQYFVTNAMEASTNYLRTVQNITIEFDKTEKFAIDKSNVITASGDDIINLYDSYYLVGPFKLNISDNRFNNFDLVLKDKNGEIIGKEYYFVDDSTGNKSSIPVFKIVDSTGNIVTDIKSNQKYYIKLYSIYDGSDEDALVSYDFTGFSLDVYSNYYSSNANFLSTGNGNDQAVIEIQKEKKSILDTITTEEEKKFDLSLRKYITKINDEPVVNSRNPQIDTSKLNTIDERTNQKITTAEYAHRKDALKVETGNIVTYNITIYNEGEKAGRATKIVDQLPTGLKFKRVVSGNFELDSYNESTDNKLILKRKDGDIQNLAAYTGGENLSSETIEIECIVTATADEKENKVLTNVAWILEEYNAVDNITITNRVGQDRDSEPETTPNANKDNMENYKGTTTETDLSKDIYYPGYQDDDDFEKVVLMPKSFDVALRKYIIAVNGEELKNETTGKLLREPIIDTDPLSQITTADYNHKKEPVEVKAGDTVTYRIATYNEGEIEGFIYSISDYLPEYLEFIPTDDFITEEVANSYIDGNISDDLKSKVENAKYIYSYDEGNRVLTIEDCKKRINKIVGSGYYLWSLDAYTKGEELDSNYIDLTFKVDEKFVPKNDTYLTNVATMTYSSKGGTTAEEAVPDIDSNRAGENKLGEEFTVPAASKLLSENKTAYKGLESNKNDLNDSEYFYKGQQDDDDFEKLVVKGKRFDLSLRKYIDAINGEKLEETRVPKIDTSKLNTIDNNGKEITTARYIHPKNPVTVKKGDLITYKIRIYNEGEIDGYATKVTDYLPEGLGFLYTITGEINSDWILSEETEVESNPLYGTNGIYKSEDEVLKKSAYKELFGEEVDLSNIKVIQGKQNEDGTRENLKVTAGGKIEDIEIKATELIKAYGANKEEGDLFQESINNENDGLFYQELEIVCIVLKENTYKGILKNVAEITGAQDSEGNEIVNPGDDRDSEPDNVYDDGKHTPGVEDSGYTPGEQDDDDFEPIQLKCFDLALRKFITGVEENGKVTEVKSRIPKLSINEETGNIKYTHPKEEAPVEVANSDIVIYTIRIFNEGTVAGYAEEITDDIPEGLEYIPTHDTNKEYEWKMIDKDGNETDDVANAVKITTDYLSHVKEISEGRNNLINSFDNSMPLGEANPDYRDVKVAFKVIEPNTSSRIIVNSAQISEDSDDDIDSKPDKWNEGEDDQDREYIYVKYFDLSLLKWVTKTIVTVDKKTTTTQTGFKPNTGKTETTGIRSNSEKEPVAKVEVDRKKLSKTTVKFVYKIRVTNEGEIAGYATQVTDYIPDGLEFVASDNTSYGWKKDGSNKVITRYLENKLLQPGESAEVEIVFRWKNNANNLGIKTNIAEISEDYNEKGAKDIDSTPDNKLKPYEKEQEDDDDFALVMLSIKTGKGASYTLLVVSMITILAGGIYLIKKYVLTY